MKDILKYSKKPLILRWNSGPSSLYSRSDKCFIKLRIMRKRFFKLVPRIGSSPSKWRSSKLGKKRCILRLMWISKPITMPIYKEGNKK